MSMLGRHNRDRPFDMIVKVRLVSVTDVRCTTSCISKIHGSRDRIMTLTKQFTFSVGCVRLMEGTKFIPEICCQSKVR